MNARELLTLSPVMPVIVIDQVAQAVPLAKALLAGGIRTLEVTLRTSAALEAIREISRSVPEAMVGAGTIITPEDILKARQAGAKFGLSPGATPALLAAGRIDNWPFIPGVATASEVMNAYAAGYDTLKFFPAQQAGGVAALKAIAGPMPQIMFCPTGGIDEKNVTDYLALPNVGCVGGSWIVPKTMIAAADWAGITRLAAQAAALR